jgi:hypothetical protein
MIYEYEYRIIKHEFLINILKIILVKVSLFIVNGGLVFKLV